MSKSNNAVRILLSLVLLGTAFSAYSKPRVEWVQKISNDPSSAKAEVKYSETEGRDMAVIRFRNGKIAKNQDGELTLYQCYKDTECYSMEQIFDRATKGKQTLGEMKVMTASDYSGLFGIVSKFQSLESVDYDLLDKVTYGAEVIDSPPEIPVSMDPISLRSVGDRFSTSGWGWLYVIIALPGGFILLGKFLRFFSNEMTVIRSTGRTNETAANMREVQSEVVARIQGDEVPAREEAVVMPKAPAKKKAKPAPEPEIGKRKIDI